MLNGTWTMDQVTRRTNREGEFRGVQGNIPGSVVSFLLDDGQIDDPYYRDNEKKTLSLFEDDYTFSRNFDVSEEDLGKEHQVLRLNGVDTLAEIFLNGVRIGETFNMHRFWEFDVKGLLRTKENRLEVRIKSPLKFIREKDKEYHLGGSYEAMRGFPHLRKAHCMFGWDWGPRIPDMGIFRDVKLLFWSGARIADISIHQDHEIGEVNAVENDHRVALTVNVRLDHKERPDGLENVNSRSDDPETMNVRADSSETIKIRLISPDGKKSWQLENGVKFEVSNPELWWPNGLGAQPLYTVIVELVRKADAGSAMEESKSLVLKEGRQQDQVVEHIEKRIGLRTLTVCRKKDEWGETFAQEINGQTFFAMGADYIPEDNVFSRMNSKRTAKMLRTCVDSNFNSIRVWGGGIYPEDYFFDLCDKLGLVVWQDLMFACAYYKMDEDLNADGIKGETFEQNISTEIEQNLVRIRHHACIGIISGNNEMESFAVSGGYECTNENRRDYLYQNEILTPKIMKKAAPDLFYWPSSPSSGGSFNDPQDENRGDVHFWAVWHSNVPFTDYRSHYFRYLSEFGFQSFPDMETIRSFTKPEDRNIFSYVMEMHQRNSGANGKILNYLSQNYRYPGSFELLVYASQLLQADAIRYGVEHFRRNRNDDRCMGAIYWQLNDIWPVASWASYDYFGHWKALQYAAKRFFAPVMISCEETSIVSEGRTCISDPSLPEVVPEAKLCVANETWDKAEGTVSWNVQNADGNIVRSGEEEIAANPFSSCWLPKLDLSGMDIYREHLSYAFTRKDGTKISSGTVLFCPPKHYHFSDPHLTITVSDDGTALTVHSDAFAKSVEIYSEDGYIRTSDNFFDMEPGDKTVKLLEGSAKDLKARSVFDIR